MTADVVIIGGGVVGTSVALHLRQLGVNRVLVVERDLTYSRASSSLAFGGIRQAYSSPINVALARASLAFFRTFDARVAAIGHGARIGFDQHGWLTIVDRSQAASAERRLAEQQASGALVGRVEPDVVAAKVPGVRVDDVAFGVFAPEDGSLDPRAVLQGLRLLATDAGVTFLNGEVIGLRVDAGRVGGLALSTSDYLASECVVCAAGAYSGQISALADVPVPVVPVRQQLFRAEVGVALPAHGPAVVLPSGVYWRQERRAEGDGPVSHILCGWTQADAPIGERAEVDPRRWHDAILPDLARRVPAFSSARLAGSWAGLYEMTADHHPLLGEHPAVRGFYLACGFSGHGLMLSPAVGATLASVIVDRSSAIDITPFAPDRFERGAGLVPDDLP